MSEEAAVGTPVGVILAAAVNQTIVYSIVEGNRGGERAPEPRCGRIVHLHERSPAIASATAFDFLSTATWRIVCKKELPYFLRWRRQLPSGSHRSQRMPFVQSR